MHRHKDKATWIRHEWLDAGQRGARWVALVCILILGGLFFFGLLGLGHAQPRQAMARDPGLLQVPLDAPPGSSGLALLSTTEAHYQPNPTVPLRPTVTLRPYAPRVGIVAGHWWPDETGQSRDVGAVCDEGTPNQLTELEVNLEIAQRVVSTLQQLGYRAELLQEWDERLDGYRADVLVSIHADACLYPEASGFKVARVVDSAVPEEEDRLIVCLVRYYGARTGLYFHQGSVTADMTVYHTFYEIAPETPAVIMETGFMLADRELLTQRPDLVAQGIVDGIVCFLQDEYPGE